MPDALDALIDQAIAAGVTPDQLKNRAEARSSEPTKQYFLDDLIDPGLSPEDYAVKLRVSSWPALLAFFRKPSTEAYDLQRAYQSLRQDIRDAIAARDAEKLILALLLAAKAVA